MVWFVFRNKTNEVTAIFGKLKENPSRAEPGGLRFQRNVTQIPFIEESTMGTWKSLAGVLTLSLAASAQITSDLSEKVISLPNPPHSPVAVVRVMNKGILIEKDSPFEAGPDWLRDISIAIKNTSPSKIIFCKCGGGPAGHGARYAGKPQSRCRKFYRPEARARDVLGNDRQAAKRSAGRSH